MTNMLEEALRYAEKGWYVFPCREKPGSSYVKNGITITRQEKSPYTSNGLLDATRDRDQITAWWTTWKDALIGVNAGKSGLFVVDIDKKHVNGFEEFSKWGINDEGGLHTITPSGGMHIIFKGHGATRTRGDIGIDTRGDGGYFIAPPSEILAGEYCGKYERFDDWNKVPGIIPDGLMSKLFPEKTTEYVRGKNEKGIPIGKYKLSRKTLEFTIDGAQPGDRNISLFTAAMDFAGCGYDIEVAKAQLFPICRTIGLDDGEIEATILKAYSRESTPAIPFSIQKKLMEKDENIAGKITFDEQVIMEDALLACIMKDNSLIPVIEDILRPEDFQVLKNRFIYKAVLNIFDIGRKADYLTVSDELKKRTDKVNLDDISKIIEKYDIDIENAISYAHILKEKSSLRKVESLMDNKDEYLRAGSLVEVIATIEKDISDIALYGGAHSANILDSEQVAKLAIDRMTKIRKGEIQQLKIGFETYDKLIGGLYNDELVVCAARAGEGKSALALSIANHVAFVEKKKVAFFTLEMSIYESYCRLVCQLTGLPFKDVYHGNLNGTEWDTFDSAHEKIAKSGIFFDESFGMTVPEIRSKIRKLKKEHDIALVVIDQLEKIRSYEGIKTYEKFDRIAYDIKDMTQEFSVPIILNHQLNRNITDRHLKDPTPQLSDLNQAGEKPANQVWAIQHRLDDDKNFISSVINVIKNRNGPQLVFPVRYVADRMLFSNPAFSSQEKHEPPTKRQQGEYTFSDIEAETQQNIF